LYTGPVTATSYDRLKQYTVVSPGLGVGVKSTKLQENNDTKCYVILPYSSSRADVPVHYSGFLLDRKPYSRMTESVWI